MASRRAGKGTSKGAGKGAGKVAARVAATAKRVAPTILVTGFEPFGGDAINPSAMLAQALDGQRVGGHRVVARVLPCVFDRARIDLNAAIDAVRPSFVLCTGLAAGRMTLSFERVAINLVDARIPDNDGAAPIDARVTRSTRDAWFTNLPVKAMAQAALDEGVMAEVSLSAGTFVCNAVFFALMERVARERRRGTPMRGGFMHVPSLAVDDEATDALPEAWSLDTTMSLDTMRRGTLTALAAAVTHVDDLHTSAGRIA